MSDRTQPMRAMSPHLQSTSTSEVSTVLDSLSDEELVGQLLCVYQRGPRAEELLAKLERSDLRPGGFFVAGGSTTEGTRDRVQTMAAWSRVAPLVAANLESGSSTFALDGELLANPLQVAASGDPHYAHLLGEHSALLAHRMGVNWAFAPVVDLVYSHHNPITGVRTFGADPVDVARHGVAFISALQAAGIAACAKHWPGDGVDDRDQHLVTSVNSLDEDEWDSGFGEVYRAVVEAGVHTIMVGHIAAPGLLGGDHPEAYLPASQSHGLIDERLRGRLGFKGLVVSDNTLMAGFNRVMPRSDAVVTAVAAGCDMLLGGDYTLDDFQSLLAAVESGRLSRERLLEAVTRVLTLKHSLGMLAGDPASVPVEPAAGWQTDLARASVTLTKDVEDTLPLTAAKYPAVLVYVLGDEPTFYQPASGLASRFAEGLRARGSRVDLRRVPGEGRTPRGERDLQRSYDLVVYFANVPFASTSNVSRIAWSYPQGPEVPRNAEARSLLVSVADPFHLQDLPSVGTAVNGYTPSEEVVDAVLECLAGEAEWRGVSPVDPFCGYEDARVVKPRVP